MLNPRDEQGIALVLAMLIMLVFAIALSAVIYYTSTNARSSSYAKAQQLAYGLAEAGINNQLAVLFNPTNSQDLLNPNLLPAQGPINVFIHHNTLHAFEDLPFDEAVKKGAQLYGCQPYLTEDRQLCEKE